MSEKRFLRVIEEDERFTYTPESLPDVTITYRRLTADAISEIDRTYQKVDHRRGRQTYIPPDRQRDRAMDIWDYIVLDWNGVVGKDGVSALPCTRENKYKLPGKTKGDILELADADDVSEMRGAAGAPNS